MAAICLTYCTRKSDNYFIVWSCWFIYKVDGKSDIGYDNNKDGGGVRNEDVKKSKGVLDVVHTRRWKPTGLAWWCIECRNSIWWAQQYGLVKTTLALAYMLHYLSAT